MAYRQQKVSNEPIKKKHGTKETKQTRKKKTNERGQAQKKMWENRLRKPNK